MFRKAPILAALFLLGLYATATRAQVTLDIPRDSSREQRVVEELRRITPDMADRFSAATRALDYEDYSGGALLFQSVVDRAPGFSPAASRLALCLSFSGRNAEAVSLLEKAVERSRSPENLAMLSRLLAYPAGKPYGTQSQTPPSGKVRAFSLASEAYTKDGSDDPAIEILVARLALDLKKNEEFRDVTARLADKHANLMQAHYFNAIRLAMDGKALEAEAEIRKAEQMGLGPDVVRGFLSANSAFRAKAGRYARYLLYACLAWLGGLALLLLAGTVLSFATSRSVETLNPNGALCSLLLRCDKILLGLSCFYYYLSTPVVILQVFSVTAMVLYVCLMLQGLLIGRVMIMVLAPMVALYISYSLISSLTRRPARADAGRPLRFHEAPGLWNLVASVASEVGSPPPTDIRVTPGADLEVYDAISMKASKSSGRHRVLLIGIGLLNGLTQNALRALLASEYGLVRTAAGNDVSARISYDFGRSKREIDGNVPAYVHGPVMRYYGAGRVAFHIFSRGFIMGYNVLFRLIFQQVTHGPALVQRLLADNKAVQTYGAASFEEGLRHRIRRGIELKEVASREFANAGSIGYVQNIYQVEPRSSYSMQEKIRLDLNRPSDDDPAGLSPLARFRHAHRVISKPATPINGLAWELFKNRQGLTEEMSRVLTSSLKAARL